MTESNRTTRLQRSERLLKQYRAEKADFIWFTDEKNAEKYSERPHVCAVTTKRDRYPQHAYSEPRICPPNYNIGRAANVFCLRKNFSQHISRRPNKQTNRYRPTVLYSTNRKLRSTSTSRIESTHPPVDSAHPMKKSFPRYCAPHARHSHSL